MRKHYNIPQPELKVFCKKCQQYRTPSQTKFMNIEEDIQGRDVETFICNVCGTEQNSLVVS